MSLPFWRANALAVLATRPHGAEVGAMYIAVLRAIEQRNWQGACHASSAIFHIGLAERGVKSALCIGEAGIIVRGRPLAFDHSWVEIDGGVYDAAICQPLDGGPGAPPVVHGIDLETRKPTQLQYGVKSGFQRDPTAALIRQVSFLEYMDSDGGLWERAASIVTKGGAPATGAALRSKYGDAVVREER